MVKAIDIVELKVPAKPEYVGVVRLTVSGVANRSGFSYDDIEDIKIAVAEACTNVVNHAYSDTDVHRDIYITCSVFHDHIEVSVSDRGRGINVEKIREEQGPIQLTDTIAELKEGGLGLFLIETLMDEVEISGESGVVVVMRKFLHRSEVEHGGDSIPKETTQ